MSETQERPATLGRPIPSPAVTLETQAFWEAAKEGRFLIKRCRGCGEAFWYPRAICPLCHSSDTVWEESAGTGCSVVPVSTGCWLVAPAGRWYDPTNRR